MRPQDCAKFYNHYKTSKEKLAKYELKISTLTEIYDDYERRALDMERAATLLASTIQKIPYVHSVRWRIKNSSHLISKIIRKHESENEKYKHIDVSNYRTTIQDLIGLRALHLYKSSMFPIDDEIQRTLNVLEGPTAYIRQGDFKSTMEGEGFNVQEHADAYRSVHYIIQSTPLKETIYSELQVRTIFEEGWAEIDHDIRYPDYNDNAVVKQFLSIFNRLCGGADEMGEFVKTLTAALSTEEASRERKAKDTPTHLVALKDNLSKLQALEASKEQLEIIKALTQQINDLESSFTPRVAGSSSAVKNPYKGNESWGATMKFIADVIAASTAVETAKKALPIAADMPTILPFDLERLKHEKDN